MSQQYNSVVDMMRDLGDNDFADELQQRLDETRLVTGLTALRATAGLTQRELADKVGTLYVIDEHAIDDLEECDKDTKVDLGVAEAYAKAMGYKTTFGLEKIQKDQP